MGYTTDNDVRYYISALGSAAGGIGTAIIGTYPVALNIAWSDAIIDLTLSKRYEVPFGTTPPAIAAISTTLASWKSLRGIYSGEIPAALQFIQDDYKKAMEFLGLLRDGSMDLPSGTATSTSGVVIDDKGHSTKVWSSTMDYNPVFDLDDDLNQRVPTDRLNAIEAARG